MSQPAAPSVRDWLAALGLPQYAESFERQAIDFDVLPELGQAELEKLGVQALGHRLKIGRAIAALKSPQALSSGSAPGVAGMAPAELAEPAALAAPAAPAAPAMSAERRQITVMFCDLVGSTALSQQLDPEDLRDLMQRYQRICLDAVQRGDGHVAQFLGDGLMVYFGWPRAHEDDAARALAVALEIAEAVKAMKAGVPTHVRIGIATGDVVVGVTVGADATLPSTAVGETPNLAARVQALAQPDQVVMAASTRRLVGDTFEVESLGEHALKGIAQPVQAWRVLGQGAADGRFAAAHGSRLTPLVNRELELALLMDRWARACDGQGQAVLLVGEPGIGKSRITAELCERAGADRVLMRAQCSELHANSAFYPLTALLRRAAGFERGDAPALQLDKLEALLERLGIRSPATMPYYAALLSLPLDRWPALRSSAPKLKRDTVDALVQGVLDAAARRPQVLLFEDLHWMDPSTLEFLDALVAAIRRAPVLLVMTARTNLGARWDSHPHVGSHGLLGLNRDHSLLLAGAVAASCGLPARMLERIVERSDGVPLFLEEVTRALLEGDELRAAGGLAAARLDSIEIPATLKDSLSARLDQLGHAKRLAQLGSVLGRQFRHELLLALAGVPEAELAEQMDRLIGAGLASRSGAGTGLMYAFHHALVQDAAYESLLKSERKALHARVAEVLAGQFAEVAEHEPEQLARHYAAAEAWAQAVPLWLKAGQQAWQRSAAQEAIAHLSAGLAWVDRVPDPAARAALELRLQSALGVVYFAAVSYVAPQAQQAFLRALELCERVPDLALKVPVLYGIGAFQTMKGDIRAGHQAFERLRAEADAAAQPRLQLYAQSVLTWSHHNEGRFDEAVAAADRTLRLYESGALSGPRLSAADPKVISECFRAASLWALGHVDQARAASDALLAHARALGDPYSLAYALNYAAVLVPDLCGEHALVLERTEEGIRLAADLGYPFLEVFGALRRAWTQGQTGDPLAALVTMDEALGRIDALGVRYHYAQLLARRARLLLRAGQEGAAQLVISQALAQVEASGERSIEADVAIAEGEVLAAHGGEQRALAEAALRVALDLAREQGARSWQLRAATALARLAAEQDDRAGARELLAPLLAGFSEGHDTADLRAAAALLATLA